MTKRYRHLTPEELYALERQAQRLRAETLAGLFRSAAAGLRSVFSVRTAGKGMRHA